LCAIQQHNIPSAACIDVQRTAKYRILKRNVVVTATCEQHHAAIDGRAGHNQRIGTRAGLYRQGTVQCGVGHRELQCTLGFHIQCATRGDAAEHHGVTADTGIDRQESVKGSPSEAECVITGFTQHLNTATETHVAADRENVVAGA